MEKKKLWLFLGVFWCGFWHAFKDAPVARFMLICVTIGGPVLYFFLVNYSRSKREQFEERQMNKRIEEAKARGGDKNKGGAVHEAGGEPEGEDGDEGMNGDGGGDEYDDEDEGEESDDC
jgi:hypothetical protein